MEGMPSLGKATAMTSICSCAVDRFRSRLRVNPVRVLRPEWWGVSQAGRPMDGRPSLRFRSSDLVNLRCTVAGTVRGRRSREQVASSRCGYSLSNMRMHLPNRHGRQMSLGRLLGPARR